LYLPIVQAIVNAFENSSIGMSPMRVVFGDNIQPGFNPLLPAPTDVPLQPIEEYVTQLNEMLQEVRELALAHLEKTARRRRRPPSVRTKGNIEDLTIGEYVLVTYPERPPDKLSPVYQGPFIIVDKKRDDIFICRDLLTEKDVEFHADRLRILDAAPDMLPDELLKYAAADHNQFFVDSIVDHRGDTSRKTKTEFKVRWKGFGPEQDTWEPYAHVRDTIALEQYIQAHTDIFRGRYWLI
jgi:hypothetical protein